MRVSGQPMQCSVIRQHLLLLGKTLKSPCPEVLAEPDHPRGSRSLRDHQVVASSTDDPSATCWNEGPGIQSQKMM